MTGYDEAPRSTEARETEPMSRKERPRVLVVDDDAELRQWIRVTLEDAGYAVVEADSGLEALEDLVETRVDVVLLDRRLPPLDATRIVRAYGSSDFPVPIIAMTGNGDSLQFAREVGAVAHLAKPFDVEDLYLAVAHASGEFVSSES